MPVITHALRAVFAYPFAVKVWEKLPRCLSIREWSNGAGALQKKVGGSDFHRTTSRFAHTFCLKRRPDYP